MTLQVHVPKPSSADGKKVASNKPVSVFIEIDGLQVRPRDTMWVVFNQKQVPVSAFPNDVNIKTDVARAARSYWMGSTEAILALNAGYSIRLVTLKEFISTVAAQMRPEN